MNRTTGLSIAMTLVALLVCALFLWRANLVRFLDKIVLRATTTTEALRGGQANDVLTRIENELHLSLMEREGWVVWRRDDDLYTTWMLGPDSPDMVGRFMEEFAARPAERDDEEGWTMKTAVLDNEVRPAAAVMDAPRDWRSALGRPKSVVYQVDLYAQVGSGSITYWIFIGERRVLFCRVGA